MFDKSQRHFFGGTELYPVVQLMQEALARSNGIVLQPYGPSSWVGRGVDQRYGQTLKVTVSTQPTPQGFALDVRTQSELASNGMIVLVAAWIFCLPAGAIWVWLAWQDFVRRHEEVQGAAWGSVRHLIVAPQFAALPH